MNGLLLIERLRKHARIVPNGVAYRQAETGEVWTWKQLDDRSQWLANSLRRQLPAGSVIALIGSNQPKFAAAFLAALRAGMAAFPMAGGPEVKELARRAGAAMILGPRISIEGEGAMSGESQTSSTAALLLTSSGTTGRPKIVRRSAASLNAVIEAMCGSIGFGPADRVLAMAPLHHSYGLEHGLLAPVAAGSAVTLCESFDLATAMREVQSGATILPAVPIMIEALSGCENCGAMTKLRKVYSAGGPLPLAIAEKFTRQLGVRVGQVYGATEIGSVTFSDPDSPDFNPRSVGRMMTGVELRLIDDQVAIRAASMFDGYLDERESPTIDGFFPTGDLGELDAAGNLLITGRIKLLIDVGGKKVNPLEVEEVLSRHPQVGACVVVPMPVAATVTRLKALVVPRRGGEAPRPEDLRAFARRRLSPYKLPRIFEMRDSLPTSATGKVLREMVKE